MENNAYEFHIHIVNISIKNLMRFVISHEISKFTNEKNSLIKIHYNYYIINKNKEIV